MKKESSLTWKMLLITALACGALVGCGGDDEGDGESGAGGGGGSGGSGGTDGGDSGAGATDGGSGSGGSGGTGGSGGMGGSGGFAAPECPNPLPSTPLICGGDECPMPMGLGGFDLCSRPCCVNDACGTKSEFPGMETECTPIATVDPSCPSYEYMGMPIEGCCVDNKCGIISALRGGGCFTTSQGVMLPDEPQACGDGGDEDAGSN